ncbi:MAG: thiol reductant ABC exporter subunit CydC [Anaerolineae bacterium]
MTVFLRLLRLIAPYKGWVALAVLLSFLTVGSSVGLMAMSAYLISKSAVVTDVADIALIVTLVRVFAIARAVFRYLERYLTHTATFRILTHLRVWFFASIEPLAPARLMQYRSGDLLARIVGDIGTLENFYVRVVVPPIAAAMVTLVACAVLGQFSPALGVALFVFLALTGIVLPLFTRWVSLKPAGAVVALRSELNAALVDQIQGLSDLLAFDQAEQHQDRTQALSRDLIRAQQRLALFRGTSQGIAALLTSLAGVTMLLVGIPLVTSGQMDGVFLALLPLTAIAAFEAVQPLSMALQQLEANQAAGKRLFELIDAEPEIREPATPSPRPADYSLTISGLSFRYTAGEPLALDRVSLTIPAGGRLVMMGPSGSGKSTLVNLLVRFREYETGEICIGGHDLHEWHSDDARSLMGVVSQQVHLFNTSVRDNLLVANPDATDEQIENACRIAQLHDFIESLPMGYDTRIGENGVLLSGGERQRLAIARVVLKSAPILVLDEATANLDALTEQRLMASLEPFMASRTVLMIAHRMPAMSPAPPVVQLVDGRIVEPGY